MIKIIWTYWHGKNNKLLDVCLESWKIYLPDWDIRIINKDSLKNYDIKKPLNYNKLTQTTKSDVIRLNLLYKYGGIWLDRSVLLNESFDWLRKYEKYPYFGFKLTTKKYMESWFIMCPKKYNKFIGAWRDILNEILDTNPMTNHPAYLSSCVNKPNYFMIYQAYCYLVNNKFKNLDEKIPFIVKNDF